MFLDGVDFITTNVTTKALTTKQLPAPFIKMLLSIYTYWKHNDLLEDPSDSDNKFTLLDRADKLLANSA